MKRKLNPQQLERAQLAELRRIVELKNLSEKYLVKPGMTAQEVFDSFIAVEQTLHREFMANGERSKTQSKRLYWFTKATSLNTGGGQNRLRKLLTLAAPAKAAPAEKVVTD